MSTCACVALLALCALPAARAAEPAPNATFYQQGLSGKEWNAYLKATIPAGQCTAELDIKYVCGSRVGVGDYAHSWLVVVWDGAVPLVRMDAGLVRARVYRDLGAPHAGACARPATLASWAHCAHRPYNDTDTS